MSGIRNCFYNTHFNILSDENANKKYFCNYYELCQTISMNSRITTNNKVNTKELIAKACIVLALVSTVLRYLITLFPRISGREDFIVLTTPQQ